jgi:signal transduction histidine kinase
MSRILAGLRTADRPGVDPDQVLEANRTAVREIESLTQVFDKLLQIAEAEAGTRRQEFEPVDAGAIMRDVVELFASVAEEQGTVLVDRTETAVTVLGDRDLLAGVAANLVENALRHAGNGAHVSVGAMREGDEVVLSVTDNGPGVPPAALERLGTRFFRPNRGMSGTGLGLASARAVVQLHGGTIEFADARPGLAARIRLSSYVA